MQPQVTSKQDHDRRIAGPRRPPSWHTTGNLALNHRHETVRRRCPSPTLSPGQQHTTTVPVGAKCTVTETGTPEDDSVTYNGHAGAPTLPITGATTLAVTNTFPAPAGTTPPSSTTTTATATTTTATTAMATTATVTSGAIPEASPAAVTQPATSPLAVTGANLLGRFGDGATLIVFGTTLAVITRRRRR
jgi:hypothetical protein